MHSFANASAIGDRQVLLVHTKRRHLDLGVPPSPSSEELIFAARECNLLSEKCVLSVIPTRDPRYGHVLAETVPLGPQNTATDGAIALTCVFWQTGQV